MRKPKDFKKICKNCKHFSIGKFDGISEPFALCDVQGKKEPCSWNHNGFGVCSLGSLMEIKNMSALCSEIAKREAGKSQVSIGNIREIMRCLADLMIETNKAPLDILADYAARRANRRRKK